MIRQIYIIVLLLVVASGSAFAQQKPQWTQYMINPFILNPAVAGTEDYIDVRAGYRNQWVGFEGAPKTMYLSGHAALGRNLVMNNRSRNRKNGFHGVGGLITNDVTGPSSRTTANLAYSYHLSFSKKIFASLGIMGGIQQYSLDANKLYTANPGDQAIVSFNKVSLADINAGFWIYSQRFYVGGSMTQIGRQVIFDQTKNQVLQGRLTHHYFLMGGLKIPFAYDFTFIPSVCLKYVNPAPTSIDVNAKVRYKNICWAGVSYRYRAASAVMAGVIINNFLDISYSYDFTTTDIRKYINGTHEIVVGVRIKPKSRIICPSNFW